MEEKINRFIDQLVKRNDEKLNEFFFEIAKELEKQMQKDAEILSERGMMEFEMSKIRYENKKFVRILRLLCMEKATDITNDELELLEKFAQGKYYTAATFFDTIYKIKSVKGLMGVFYPKKDDFPRTIEELNKGDEFLNQKIWDLTRN